MQSFYLLADSYYSLKKMIDGVVKRGKAEAKRLTAKLDALTTLVTENSWIIFAIRKTTKKSHYPKRY